MDGNGPTRRDYISVEAVEPKGGKTLRVQISFDRMQTVGRRSMGHAKECAFILPEVLQRPTAICEGLRMDEDEDRRGAGWRCYCGRPNRAYLTDGTERAPYENQVYLVFVNDQGVAYNWRWEKSDPDDPDLPMNHGSRFRQRLL